MLKKEEVKCDESLSSMGGLGSQTENPPDTLIQADLLYQMRLEPETQCE
jgi:hypothetical protein